MMFMINGSIGGSLVRKLTNEIDRSRKRARMESIRTNYLMVFLLLRTVDSDVCVCNASAG
jgi:hypothetical protein